MTTEAKAPQLRHKSTTHEEMYFHVREPFDRYQGGTVFFRKENDGWWASLSRCSVNDPWSRPIGRTVARRRYFDKGSIKVTVDVKTGKPDYNLAKLLYESHLAR